MTQSDAKIKRIDICYISANKQPWRYEIYWSNGKVFRAALPEQSFSGFFENLLKTINNPYYISDDEKSIPAIMLMGDSKVCPFTDEEMAMSDEEIIRQDLMRCHASDKHSWAASGLLALDRLIDRKPTPAEAVNDGLVSALKELVDDGECYCLDANENLGRNPCGICNAKAALQASANLPSAGEKMITETEGAEWACSARQRGYDMGFAKGRDAALEEAAKLFAAELTFVGGHIQNKIRALKDGGEG